MQPRLKTSKKWTSLPGEYVEKILEVFGATFEDRLEEGESFSVDGRIYPEEVLMRVGIKHSKQLAHANFHTSVNYNSQKAGEGVEMIYLSIDAIASMIEQYLESLTNETPIDFPRTWGEFEFSGKKIHLRFSTENSDLEAQADALLGLNDHSLVHEESDVDALDRAEIDRELSDDPDLEMDAEDEFDEDLDGDEDEDIDTSKPKIFKH